MKVSFCCRESVHLSNSMLANNKIFEKERKQERCRKRKGRRFITLIEHFPLLTNVVKMSAVACLDRNGQVSRCIPLICIKKNLNIP